jgi:hypothetical protein
MSMADYLRRKQINAPKILDTQMRHVDVSAAIWRTKLAVSSVIGVGKHALNEVFNPSKTGTSARVNQLQSFKGTAFGGRNQDVSSYVMTAGARSIDRDVFDQGKIESIVAGRALNGCLTSTPASQVVTEFGNSDGTNSGLNMKHTLCKYGLPDSRPFEPQTQSQFVDYLPSIKRGLGVQSREEWSGDSGTNSGSQNPFGGPGECTSVFTRGNAKISNAADGLVPKAVVVLGKPDRPYNSDFAVLQTAPTGSQVGGGTTPGSRAPKVGAAMRKIPTGINHRGRQPTTAMVAGPYQLNNGMRSVPAINNPPGQAQ